MIDKIHDADSMLSLSKAGDLFTNDIKTLKEEYKVIAKMWHPDINKNEKSTAVFSKINILYNDALKLIGDNKWEKSGLLQLWTIDNILLNINFLSCKYFELGKLYICKNHIIYLFDEDKKIYYENAIKIINGLNFYDADMKKEINKFLPQIYKYSKLKSNEYCIIIQKNDNVFNLSDIFNYYKENFDDRHVAWIISRLLNLECYFDFCKIVHNGIDINNCFISPSKHSVYLYGGWWYGTKKHEKMIGISKEIFNIMPISAKSTKCSDTKTDLESIKMIGRKLLSQKSYIPTLFEKWLNSGVLNTAFEEMERWDDTILKIYKKRKFIKMDISNNQIYKE